VIFLETFLKKSFQAFKKLLTFSVLKEKNKQTKVKAPLTILWHKNKKEYKNDKFSRRIRKS